MILLLDLGNTNLYVGVSENGTLINEYRTDSDLNRSSDMYRGLLSNFLTAAGIRPAEFEGAILSSVIPSLTFSIVDAVERLIGKHCLVVGSGIRSGLSIRIDNPNELGADLVADSVGAIAKYGAPCIICDLGTANKFLVVDKDRNFIGCCISPGIRTAGKALTNGAAQLMDIAYKAPKKIIGKNSPDSLNSGAIYGTVAMIREMTRMIEAELGYETKHILTGGNASLVEQHIQDFMYDPSLILEGLYRIYQKNQTEISERKYNAK